jgi:hypothetical protein
LKGAVVRGAGVDPNEAAEESARQKRMQRGENGSGVGSLLGNGIRGGQWRLLQLPLLQLLL